MMCVNTVMGKIIAGWLVMIFTTVAALIVAIPSIPFVEEYVAPDAGRTFLWFSLFGSSFTGYWVSVRFVVQSRAAAPASLNNSTNSECKS